MVWFEIPVTDMERAKAFYGAVLQTELKDDNTGPNPMAMFPAMNDLSVAGHLYPGKPAKGSGNTIHLAAPEPLEDSLEARSAKNGGKVVSDDRHDPARPLRLLPRSRRQQHRPLHAN